MKFEAPKTPKPKPFQCRLISAQIEIQGQPYTVLVDDWHIIHGFLVTKDGPNEVTYSVIHKPESGINACNCPDYQYRHEGSITGMCKHARALVELGLLVEPGNPKKF